MTEIRQMPQVLRKNLTLLCLLVYWPSLFVLAHIPIPQVVRQADLSDKTLHFLAYFILVFLLWGTVRPYERVNWRRATVWIILAVVVWYGVIDECLQGYAGRSPDVMDFAADLIGAGASLLVLTLLSFWPALLSLAAMSIFVLANCSRADVTKLVPLTHTAFHLLAYGAFAFLWLVYLQRICRRHHEQGTKGIESWLGRPRSPLQGFTVSMLVPFSWLGIVKLGSLVLRRSFAQSDLIAASAGITAIACLGLFIDTLSRSRKRGAPVGQPS